MFKLSVYKLSKKIRKPIVKAVVTYEVVVLLNTQQEAIQKPFNQGVLSSSNNTKNYPPPIILKIISLYF